MDVIEFEKFNNPLINYKHNDEINVGRDPKVQQLLNKFKINDDKNGLLVYIEKVSVLKNGEWSYDTYIKSNSDITKEDVIKFINNLEKNEFDILDISHEFYGGHPMGTNLFDIKEMQGEMVWVVNLKTNLYSYLKKKGHVGNLEDLYTQIGGLPENIAKYISKDHLKKDKRSINNIIVDTINKFFFIEDNDDVKDKKDKFKEDNKYLLDNTKQVHTHYDGNVYYTFLNIYKDGKFLEKKKISSLENPINWKYILSEIMLLNKYKEYYGFVYKLSYSWNKGYILETTGDQRYFVDYNCKNK